MLFIFLAFAISINFLTSFATKIIENLVALSTRNRWTRINDAKSDPKMKQFLEISKMPYQVLLPSSKIFFYFKYNSLMMVNLPLSHLISAKNMIKHKVNPKKKKQTVRKILL